jgi:hypothetical protein
MSSGLSQGVRRAAAFGRSRGVIMFLALFFVLLVCWIFGWVVFHVAGGLIHALLVVAVISLIWHFVKDRAAV